MPTIFALSLGGDLGNTEVFFGFAFRRLREAGAFGLRRSRSYRTLPVDCVPGTPDFLNCAVCGQWGGTATELLAVTQNIERGAGRPEIHSSREARVLDCDIVLFGDEIIRTPALTVPHPRSQIRRFVLEPLAELLPDYRFPDSGRSVVELLKTMK